MPEYWITKKKVTGGCGDIEKGTLLVLKEKHPARMTFVRARPLPEGPNVQNRIIMHQPAWWAEDVRRATRDEISEQL